MKILHVNKFFDRHGGAEVYLHELMAKQRAAGHSVHVFSTRGPHNLLSGDGRYFVERLNFDRREGAWKDLRKAAKFVWNVEAERVFDRMLLDVRPDVVHLHNIYHHLSSSILAPIRKKKIPCVMTLHDYKLANPVYGMLDREGICEHAKGGKYFEIVKHRCLTPDFSGNALAAFEMTMTKWRQSYERTADFFLCPSRFMQAKMVEWGEPKEKLKYIPNPVDLPPTIAPRGGGYILYAGRLSPEKGLASFLQAAAQVPELEVRIAGRGPEEEKLRRIVRDLGASHIEFVGFLTPLSLAHMRERAEAVVLPSIGYENASTSLLEAMASGLPCLATNIGGNPELVEDEVNGLLVHPGDVEDWVRTFRRFLSLPDDVRAKMGKRGREKVLRHHTWEQHLVAVTAAYQQAMQEKK